MKKFFILLSVIMLLLSACTSYEIRNEIKPKINVVGDKIGLKYNLGNIKVVDSFDDLTNKMFEHVVKHADGLTLTLIVSCDNSDGGELYTHFAYYLDGVLLEINTNVVSSESLLQNYDSIEGFIIHEVNGKSFEEWRDDVKEERKDRSTEIKIVPEPNQEQTNTTPPKKEDMKL